MSFPLFFIGFLLVVVGVKDTWKQLGSQLYSDFVGPGGFLYWLLFIAIAGAIGYYPPWRVASRLLIALAILSFILKNWSNIRNGFMQLLQSGPVQAQGQEPPMPQDIPVAIHADLQGLGSKPLHVKLEGGGSGAGGAGALGGAGG